MSDMMSRERWKTVHSIIVTLTVKWLQKVWRAALDAELQRAQQQLERYDQVIVHLQAPSCREQGCSTWEASQSHEDRQFPKNLSSRVKIGSNRTDGKKLEQQESYSTICMHSLSLLGLLLCFKMSPTLGQKKHCPAAPNDLPLPGKRDIQHLIMHIFLRKSTQLSTQHNEGTKRKWMWQVNFALVWNYPTYLPPDAKAKIFLHVLKNKNKTLQQIKILRNVLHAWSSCADVFTHFSNLW